MASFGAAVGRPRTTHDRETAVLAIEFGPPNVPQLRARIERLDTFDDDGGTPEVAAIETVSLPDLVFEVDAESTERRTFV
jgi:hypothetical protein